MNKSKAPEKRKNSAGEKTRKKILDVAETLFAEQGIEGTTLQDIAEGCGMQKPSLYRHYPSKQAIHAAVMDRGFASIKEVLNKTRLAGDREATRLNIGDSVAKRFREHHQIAKILLRGLMQPPGNMDDTTLSWIRDNREHFYRLVKLYDCEDEREAWIRMAASIYISLGYYATEGLLQELGVDDFLEAPATDYLERTLDTVLTAFLAAK